MKLENIPWIWNGAFEWMIEISHEICDLQNQSAVFMIVILKKQTKNPNPNVNVGIT